MRTCSWISAAIAVVVVMLVSIPPGAAQVRSLSVESNMKAAHVFVDGKWMGRVSDSPFLVSETARQLVVKPEDLDAWAIEPVRFDLTTGNGDGTLDARFPYHYRVESSPPGADVFFISPSGNEWLGETPLIHKSHEALMGEFRVAKEGHVSVRLEPGQQFWNHNLATLRINGQHAAHRVGLTEINRRRRWIDVAALSTAVVAGALAVHYRTKADHRFERWQETQDSNLKDRVQRLDVYSGVAVGTMQVGLGVFAFRLIF